MADDQANPFAALDADLAYKAKPDNVFARLDKAASVGANLDTEAPVGSPGFMGGVADFGRRLVGGTISSLPEQVGQAFQFFGAEDTGKQLQAFAKEHDYPALRQSQIGQIAQAENVLSPRGAAASAGENTPLSVGPGVVGAGIGAGIGSAIAPGPGTIAGAGLGWLVGSLGALPIFYGSQAQQSKEAIAEGLRKNHPEMSDAEIEAQATKGGHIAGGFEAGGELAADLIPVAKLFKPLTKPIEGALVKSVLGGQWKRAAATMGEIKAGEIGTEMAQQAAEKQTEAAYGADHEGATVRDTASVIVPTAIMSLFPGGLTVAHNFHTASKVKSALSDGEADPERRAAAASVVFHEIGNANPNVASAFDEYAAKQIDAGEPIAIEDDQFYLREANKAAAARAFPSTSMATPSQQLGLDPNAGMLSAGAATAVDSGFAKKVAGDRTAAVTAAQQAQDVEALRKENPEITDEEITKALQAQAEKEQAQEDGTAAVGEMPPFPGQRPPEDAYIAGIQERAAAANGEPSPLLPLPTPEAALAAAAASKLRTGQSYEVIPHPRFHDKFAIRPITTEAGNAVQEQGAGGVLQREPGATGEGGGERGRVEQGQQGQGGEAAGALGQGPETRLLQAPGEKVDAAGNQGPLTAETYRAVQDASRNQADATRSLERARVAAEQQSAAQGTVDKGAHEAAASPGNDLTPPTTGQAGAGNYKVGPTNLGPVSLQIENPEGSERSNLDVPRLQQLHDRIPADVTGLAARGRDKLAAAIEQAKAGQYGDALESARQASNLLLAKFPTHSETLDKVDSESWATKMQAHYGRDAAPVKGRDGDKIDWFVKPGTPTDYSGPLFVIDQVDKAGNFDEHKVMGGYATQEEAVAAYKAHYPADWKVGTVTQTTPEAYVQWRDTGDTTQPFSAAAAPAGETGPTGSGGTTAGPREPGGTPIPTPAPEPEGRPNPPSPEPQPPVSTPEPTPAPAPNPPSPEPTPTPTPTPTPKPEPKPPKPPGETVTVAQAKKVWKETTAAMEEEERKSFGDNPTWRILDGAPHVINEAGDAYHFFRLDKQVLWKEGFVSDAARRRHVGKQTEEKPDAVADMLADGDQEGLAKVLYDGLAHQPTPADWPQILPDNIIRLAVDPKHQAHLEGTLKANGFKVTDRATPIASETDPTPKITLSAIHRPEKGGITDVGGTMAGGRKEPPKINVDPKDSDEEYVDKLLESLSKATLLDPRMEHGTFGSFMFREAFFDDIDHPSAYLGRRFQTWQTKDKPRQALLEAVKAGRKEEITTAAGAYLSRLVHLAETLEKPETVAEVAQALREQYVRPDGHNVTETHGRDLARLMPKWDLPKLIDSLEKRYGPNEHSTDQSDRQVKRDPRVPPRLEKIVRVGLPDRRGGRNIDAESDFKDTFGFRGVEFGNWVNQTERQENLNLAYDAFLDLADQIKAKPVAISIGEALGLAFGARGRGKASAHYEPDNNVINLTRHKGNGTVAHEWMHALEQRLRGDPNGKALTDQLRTALKQKWKLAELELRVRSILKSESTNPTTRNTPPKDAALNWLLNTKWLSDPYDKISADTAYFENARAMDDGRPEPYWSTPHELVARGFESAMFDRLKGGSPYLVGPTVADGYTTPKNGYAGTPYPLGEERKLVEEVYNHFLGQINWDDLSVKTYTPQYSVHKDARGGFHIYDQHWMKLGGTYADEKTAKDLAAHSTKNAQPAVLGPSGAAIARAHKEAWDVGQRIEAIMKELGISEAPEVKNGSMAESMFFHLRNGWWPKNNADLIEFAKQAFRVDAIDRLQQKQAQEDFEAALGKWAGQRITDLRLTGADDRAIFDFMVEQYKRQPNLDVRTSTSMINQGYSTPLPIAYLSGLLVRATRTTVAYEPTAGNGLLAFTLNPANVIANELEPHRAQNLRLMNFERVHEGNALDADTRKVFKPQEADVLLTNPPFGTMAKAESVDGYQIRAIDQLIAARSLAAMKDDGRAVIILGAMRDPGVISARDTPFLNWVYAHYNVADHFEVHGDLYSRQGASWPLRVLVIAGRQLSDKLGPKSGEIQRVNTFDELWDRYVQALGRSEQILVGSVRAPGGARNPAGEPGTVPGGGGSQTPGSGDGEQPAGGAGGAAGGVGGLGGTGTTGNAGAGGGESAGGPTGTPPAGGGGPGVGGPAAGGRGKGDRGRAGGANAGGRAGGGAKLGELSDGDIDALFGDAPAPAGKPKGKGKGKGANAGGEKPPGGKPPKVKFEKGKPAQLPEVYVSPLPGPDPWRETVKTLVRVRPFFNELRIDESDGRWQLDPERTLRFSFFSINQRPLALGEANFVPGPRPEYVQLHGVEHADGTYEPIDNGLYQVGALALPTTRVADTPPLLPDSDPALDGLADIFGAKFSLNDPHEIDNQVYARAKPLFQQVWDKLMAEIGEIKAVIARFITELVARYNEKIKPYLKAFVKEKRDADRWVPPHGKPVLVQADADNELQRVYEPRSKRPMDGIYVPSSMAEATQAAFDQLETKYASDYPGGLDEMVQKELGYASLEELWYGPSKDPAKNEGLGAYQIDALALAIDKMKGGDGIIIGDDTGVGKGRTAAAIIAWAARQGKVPIFLSVKDDLYTDMVRDLKDIGKGDLKFVITNTDTKVYDNSEVDAKGNAKLVLQGSSAEARRIAEYIKEKQALPDDAKALFTTYSQLNQEGGNGGRRRDAIRALVASGKAVFVMDEAHNAAGDSSTGEFFQSLLTGNGLADLGFNMAADWQPPATTYLSATYAKRPDNLPVYVRTHIRYVGQTADDLKSIFKSGGPLLQQVTAAMLAQSGQLIRRERSYANLKIDYEVDEDHAPVVVRHVDAVTDVLRATVRADRALTEALQSKEYQQYLLQNVLPPGAADGMKKAEIEKALQHGLFTSVVHNSIAQLLLAAKLDFAVTKGIAALNAGQKPVFTLHNTMEAMLRDYAAQTDAATGDELKNFGWKAVTQRALDNTRHLRFTTKQGVKMKLKIPLQHIPGHVQMEYRAAQAKIDAMNVPLSAAPIDELRHRLAQYVWYRKDGQRVFALPKDVPAGVSTTPVKVSEITGRSLAVDLSGPVPKLATRNDGNSVDLVREFQNGAIDVMVLNSAGSTGISLHAGVKAQDQSVRHMLVLQPSPDISVFKQTLGRINRTGQVELPVFTVLASATPAERRPMAMLRKKMKSLTSNTSANNRTATDVEATDFINEYGDAIVAQYLREHREVKDFFDIDVPSDDSALPEDLALKASGKAGLLSVEDQGLFFDEVERNYEQEIAMRNQTGTNRLERRVLPLDAVPEKEALFLEGDDNSPDAPLRGDAYLTQYDVNILGVPPTPEQVRKEIASALNGRKPFEVIAAIEADLQLAFDEAKNQKALKIAEYGAIAADNQRPPKEREEYARRHAAAQAELAEFAKRKEETLSALRNYQIGAAGIMRYNDVESFAAVVGYKVNKPSAKAGNPYAPSNFVIQFLRNIPDGAVALPLSKIEKLHDLRGPSWRQGHDFDHEFRDRNTTGGREKVRIITGNIPAALGQTNGAGEIVSFTTRAPTATGEPVTGLLMPATFNPGDLAEQDYSLREPQQAIDYLMAVGHAFANRQAERNPSYYQQYADAFAAARGTSEVPAIPADERPYHFTLFAKKRVVQLQYEPGQGNFRFIVDRTLGSRWIKNKTIVGMIGDLSGMRGGSYMEARVPIDKVAPLVKFLRLNMPLYVLSSKADLARSFLPKKEDGKLEVGVIGGGMKPQQVADALSPITRAWKNAPRMVIVNDVSQIPFKVPPNTRGVFYDGKVHLVASNLKNADAAQFVLLHEVAGHYGLAGIFGHQLDAIMERIYHTNDRVAREAEKKRELYGKAGRELSIAGAVEEVLADMAGRNEVHTVNGWRMLVAAIRKLLRDLGFSLAMSDNDVRALLTDARRYVENGIPSGPRYAPQAAQAAPATSPKEAMFSLATDGLIGRAVQEVYDHVNQSKQFNWLHRRVATQFHKAQINPYFRPVFQEAQRYLQDVSAFANQAADEVGDDVLPRLGRVADVFKNSSPAAVKRINNDLEQAGKAMWVTTLTEYVPTDAELASGFTATARDAEGVIGDMSSPPLTPKQIEYYHRSRNAIRVALNQAAVSEMARVLRAERYPGRVMPTDLELSIRAAKDNPNEGYNLISTVLHERAAQLRANGDLTAAAKAESSIDEIEKLNDRVEELVAKGYAPLMRFGKHTVTVTEVRDGMHPTKLYFGMFESAKEANQMVRDMQEQYPNASVTLGTLDEASWKLYRGLSLDSLEAFANATGLQEFPMFQEYLKTAVASRSAMKRLIHRKGIQGYNEDLRRVLASFITSQARLASKNHHFAEMVKAQQAIPETMGVVREEAAELVHYVQNPTEEAQALRGFLFTNFIGGSVASALTNMTQPIMMTLPYLSQFGGPARASQALYKALDVAGGGVSSDEDLRLAMDRAAKEGITEPQEIHQLYAESIRGLGSNLWVRKGLRVWGSMFALAESFNRRITFAAAFRMANDREALAEINRVRAERSLPTFQTAFDFAESAVEDTQGIYNRGNRPNWARGAIGATLFTFKQFTIAYLEFLSRLPAREKALAGAVLLLAAGLQGAPGADDLENLIDTIGQLMGYNTNSKKALREGAVKILGESLGGLLTHGVSGIPGVPLDIQGRMGIHQLIPFSGLFKPSDPDKMQQFTQAVGPVGGLVQQVARGVGALEAGQYGSAFMQGAPVAVQNFLRGLDMAQAGAYRDYKGRKVVDTDSVDATLKMLGIQPQDVAFAQRRQSDVRQDIDMVKTTEANIADRWARAVLDKDQDGLRRAMQDLVAWNTKNPTMPIRIDPRQIQERIRAAMLTREQRTVKSAPTEIRLEVLESLRGT